MARQKGIIKFEGTLDEITFYKTQDGYLAKTKSGVSAERIATDPAFARLQTLQSCKGHDLANSNSGFISPASAALMAAR